MKKKLQTPQVGSFKKQPSFCF